MDLEDLQFFDKCQRKWLKCLKNDVSQRKLFFGNKIVMTVRLSVMLSSMCREASEMDSDQVQIVNMVRNQCSKMCSKQRQ